MAQESAVSRPLVPLTMTVGAIVRLLDRLSSPHDKAR